MESSGTTSCAVTEKPSFCRSCATVGPERSCRSPRAQESLTVTTAAVSPSSSAIEEDIFLFFPSAPARRTGRRTWGTRGRRSLDRCRRWLRFATTITRRFVEQPQPFHQQSLGVELRGLLVRFAFEVELKISTGPAQDLEHGLVADQRSIGRVFDLTFGKEHFAVFAFIAQ